jgi:hypothetical protein
VLDKGTLTKPPQLGKERLKQVGMVLQIARSIAQVIKPKVNMPKKQKERNEG